MRTRNFLVPQDLIIQFVESIEEHDFANHIVGTTRKVVNQLQDLIDEHN